MLLLLLLLFSFSFQDSPQWFPNDSINFFLASHLILRGSLQSLQGFLRGFSAIPADPNQINQKFQHGTQIKDNGYVSINQTKVIRNAFKPERIENVHNRKILSDSMRIICALKHQIAGILRFHRRRRGRRGRRGRHGQAAADQMTEFGWWDSAEFQAGECFGSEIWWTSFRVCFLLLVGLFRTLNSIGVNSR